jgi:hypothetical protein
MPLVLAKKYFAIPFRERQITLTAEFILEEKYSYL